LSSPDLRPQDSFGIALTSSKVPGKRFKISHFFELYYFLNSISPSPLILSREAEGEEEQFLASPSPTFGLRPLAKTKMKGAPRGAPLLSERST